MKKEHKILLLLVLCTLSLVRNAYSQWIQQGLGYEVAQCFNAQLICTDENTVWGIGRIEIPNTYIQKVSRTLDGGLNWDLVNIPGYPNNMMYNFSAVDQYNAWFILVDVDSASINLLHTTDGGQTFLEINPTFNPNTLVTGIHFWDQNNGLASGFSNSLGIIRFYTTSDAGYTWQSWDSSYILNQYTSSEHIIEKYIMHDSIIKCISANGRLFTSHDWGKHWSSNYTPFYINYSFGYQIAFQQDMLHGLVCGDNNALYETFNGGITWSQVFPGISSYSTVVWIPGTANSCIRFSAELNGGCYYSTDGGHSWIEFPELHGKQLTASAWWDNHTGWIAEFTKEPNPPSTGIFKFDSIFSTTTNIQEGESFMLWPNPVTSLFNLWISPHDGSGSFSLSIIDNLGTTVWHRMITCKQNPESFNLGDVSNGCYFLVVKDNKERLLGTKKILVIK